LTDTDSPFLAYPQRPAEFAATLGATVIIIPHPDDEALGCGGLLALLRQAGQPVAAVLTSDGSQSHPHSQDFSAVARRELRYAELRHALSVLGVDESDDNVRYLHLLDGALPTEGQPGFAEVATQLADFLREKQPATVLVPWRRDPHPDHRATSQLTAAALAQLPHPPRRLEYVVWAWERAAPGDLPRAEEAVGFQLDISPVLAQKQRAIRAHRSQLAPGIIMDDPSGFLLSDTMLAHFAQPTEVFLEAPTS
jgi:LmbE family N-acetylglucosaminyl deacetylase